MIVKAILNEESLTIPEVKELLNEVRSERSDEEELGYELRRTIYHVETFSRLSPDRARKLVASLLKLEKIKPEIAVRIADLLPVSYDEIRSIYAKERFTLTEEDLKAILDLVTEAKSEIT
ncbi:RNA polymerase Rpb4 family protein [Methanosarcinales archaeon]|nr:MAG: DNA-directed RNA polymerase subunit F [Methanosarcinales archaeon ex4484_138]RLG26807.1 MAG: RNA polymerase Rpb4 family protein [Methanosarcinales archaeon]RLG35775.1 MAG: RNA polymerase Rpb4 family protein [Methanosarcinales archaeon]